VKRPAAFYPVPFPYDLPAPPDAPGSGFVAAVGDYAIRVRDYYDRRAHWHRRLYRATGIVVILVGAALPLLAAPVYPGKQLAVSLAGTLVAALTGLRAFYRWDQSWIVMRTTERAVAAAYWRWRTQIDSACGDTSVEHDVRRAATEALLERLGELQLHEAD
jgi:hypothetical protein